LKIIQLFFGVFSLQAFFIPFLFCIFAVEKQIQGNYEYGDNDPADSRVLQEGCKADGVEPAKPYSGKLNLRMSSELHSRVAAFVAATGTTINDFINNAIKNELKKVAAF